MGGVVFSTAWGGSYKQVIEWHKLRCISMTPVPRPLNSLPSSASMVAMPFALRHATLPGLVKPRFVNTSTIPKDAGSTHPPMPVTGFSNPVPATRRTHLAPELEPYPRHPCAARSRAQISLGEQWLSHCRAQRGRRRLAV